MRRIFVKARFPDFGTPRIIRNMIHSDEERHGWPFFAGIRLPVIAAILLWFAQPPFSWWPVGAVALLPLIHLVSRPEAPQRAQWLAIWFAGFAFWLLSLQGLRHAHSMMFLGWFALSGYLALYWIVFVYCARWFHHQRSLPIGISVAIAWIGQEVLRNYLLTGISACMLGHTMADVPVVIQFATWFGSYGVSLFVVMLNVVSYDVMCSVAASKFKRPTGTVDRITAVSLVTTVLVFGVWQIDRSSDQTGEVVGNFLLVQRSETVEYTQPTSRAVEIYQAYAQQTLQTLSQQNQPIDAVIWPESMYSAGNPWMEIQNNSGSNQEDMRSNLAANAQAVGLTPTDLLVAVDESQRYFEQRSAMLHEASIAALSQSRLSIDFLVGCGVMRYAETPEVYCGLIQFGSGGKVKQWYGKNHLVMFGEYIPLVSSLPWVRSLIPPGMGLNQGRQPEPMQLANAKVLPNICIETAVERVAVNHLRSLPEGGNEIDLIVTITNDGWFDASSIIDHHLRCAQLVAVGIGKPILSAANNGPTAWIDAQGRIVERVETGQHGVIVASPKRPDAETLYSKWGAWPVAPFGFATCWPLLLALRSFLWRKKRLSILSLL